MVGLNSGTICINLQSCVKIKNYFITHFKAPWRKLSGLTHTTRMYMYTLRFSCIYKGHVSSALKSGFKLAIWCFKCNNPITHDQGFIQDFEMGEKQDSSMTIVTYEMCPCLLGGSGAMPPRKIFQFTSSQIVSDTIWDKISKHFDDTYLCSVTCK